MFLDEVNIPEINYMKHSHDDSSDFVDYQNTILTNSLSPYLFGNDRMNKFLLMLQRPVSILFDNFNVIRNWKSYTVDKYEYKLPN